MWSGGCVSAAAEERKAGFSDGGDRWILRVVRWRSTGGGGVAANEVGISTAASKTLPPANRHPPAA
jgi:uncharacterized protein (DUF2237 family)